MKRFFLLFLLLIGISTSSYAGKVYKWTDDNGQIHYSTFPPAKVETENVRVPFTSKDLKDHKSDSSKSRRYTTKSERYRKAREREKQRYEEKKKKRAIKNYDRKFGAEAQLKKVEAEKRRKKAREEKVYRDRIRRSEMAKRKKEMKKKPSYKEQVQQLEEKCEAAHGTDCGNSAYLYKWANKKYAK